MSPGCRTARVSGLVRLGTGVRLDVDVFGVEELPGALPRKVLDFIGILTATVIALTGIAFGVFVGEDAARGFEDGLGGKVLAGDELDLAVLATRFREDELVDSRIYFGQGPLHGVCHGLCGAG